MTDQYAVIGHPIKHSKSPLIHTQFAHETEQNIAYTTLLAPLDAFEQTVMNFFQQQQGKGLNVTVPFKQQAWEMCDELSDYAKQAGAVNTLIYQDDKHIYGTNTDGTGIVRDLTINNALDLKNKKILILGAGGAVRGVLQPIIEQQPAYIFIANRTVGKAEILVKQFTGSKPPSCEILAGGYDDIPHQSFDIIINGTAASLEGKLPPIPLVCIENTQCCYDMMYSTEPTLFVKWGKENGVELSIDGIGMLIEQAAESFYLWRGVRPDTVPVFTFLRNL